MVQRFDAVRPGPSWWWRLVLILIVATPLLPLFLLVQTAWGAQNMAYTVTPDALQIRYGWTEQRIPLDQIQSVGLVQPTRYSRINGTGMPGLYEGRWTSEETGRITLYATRLDSWVVLTTADQKWGLTPSDPTAFQAALQLRQTATFQPAAPDRSGGWVFTLVMLPGLVVGPLLWYVFYLIARFRKGLTYELGPEGLVIRTGWRPVFIRYAEIEKAEEVSPKGGPSRLYGTCVSGCYWGAFSWYPFAKRIQLYATRIKPIVLIQTKTGKMFGLSPADSAGFLGVLHERIGR
jgi:hypothetical protein